MQDEQTEEDTFAIQKQQIKTLLSEKDIEIEDIRMKQFPSGRYQVEVYHKLCDEIEGTKYNIKKIGKELKEVYEEVMKM